MSFRHKRIVTSLDTGGSADWNDDHINDFTTYVENCIDCLVMTLTSHFDLGQETSGTATAITLVNSVTAIRLNATGGVGNLSVIRLMRGGAAGNITNKTELPIANMAVEVGGLTADNNTHLFGMSGSADNPFNPLDQGAFFRISNNILTAVTSAGAAETTTALGAPGQYGNYRIEFTTTYCHFYVGDMVNPVASHNTNLPTDDLTYKFITAQRGGGSNTMSVQAFGLAVLRDQ